jgi:chaperonin cofactor prefoldin
MNPYIPSIIDLLQRIEQLEKRIEYLEDENIGLSNELYELQNRLDILHEPKWEHLNQFSLGDS